MLVFLLVALFCIALVITLIGLYLSPRTDTQDDVAYAPRTANGVRQRKRSRNVRRNLAADQPYRQVRQSYAPMADVGVRLVPAYRQYSSSRGTGVNDIVDLWSPRLPRWLKLILFSGTIFGLCLFLFIQMMNFGPAMAIINNLVPQATPTSITVDAQNLGVSKASQSIVRIAQLDQNQYSSQDEYSTWSPSACSVAAMTEIINAYGHSYRLTDILKVESGLHEITPELGLLEDKGIYRTMAQFGFKRVPLERAKLDAAIAVANQGHPVIISFANSGYWPGGHILVLRGGDAQHVNLADSSRLNLKVVPRSQFLQWWTGFTALAVPQ
jgi:hypothetical protein